MLLKNTQILLQRKLNNLRGLIHQTS